MTTYEETKDFIEKNIDDISLLLPDFSKVKETILEVIKDIDNNCISEENCKSLTVFEDYTKGLIEDVIHKKISQKEKDIITELGTFISNLENNFKFFKEPLLVEVLLSLIAASRSLDESMLVILYLYKRISPMMYQEPSDAQRISQKYYIELTKFLSKKDHDSDYSVR